MTIIVASVSTPRILERLPLLRLDGETVDGTDSRQHHDRHPKPTFSWRTCDIAPSLPWSHTASDIEGQEREMKPPPASHVHRRPWVSHIDSSFGERSGLEAGGKGQFARPPMGMRSAFCVGTCLMQMHEVPVNSRRYSPRKESERPTTPPVRERPLIATHYCITNVAL